MKKIILTVAAIFAIGFANAQEVKFGVKAGVNFSTFTGDVQNVDGKVGFHVGALVDIKVSEKFSVQPELMYSSLGAKSEIFGTTVTTTADYIVIPVMAKYYVATGFNLEVGPQIGFIMSAKSKGGGTEIDVKEDFASTDFGANFGAGYDFTENISAGVRYTLGLSNVAKNSGSDKIHNSNLGISLAYKF